jgi:hypothetical protein
MPRAEPGDGRMIGVGPSAYGASGGRSRMSGASSPNVCARRARSSLSSKSARLRRPSATPRWSRLVTCSRSAGCEQPRCGRVEQERWSRGPGADRREFGPHAGKVDAGSDDPADVEENRQQNQEKNPPGLVAADLVERRRGPAGGINDRPERNAEATTAPAPTRRNPSISPAYANGSVHCTGPICMTSDGIRLRFGDPLPSFVGLCAGSGELGELQH